MPALARVGLLILAVGLFADLAYHSLPLSTAPFFGSDGVGPHLVVFVGMVVVVCGVIGQGLAIGHSQSVSERGN